jgi:hypothetical protein
LAVYQEVSLQLGQEPSGPSKAEIEKNELVEELQLSNKKYIEENDWLNFNLVNLENELKVSGREMEDLRQQKY